MPAPTTIVAGVVSTTSGTSGSEFRVLAMPARTRAMALAVAPSGSSPCAHESCSRMLTWL